jgi:hypothetical protein
MTAKISEKEYLETSKKISDNLTTKINSILKESYKRQVKLTGETESHQADQKALGEIQNAWKEYYQQLEKLTNKEIIYDE